MFRSYKTLPCFLLVLAFQALSLAPARALEVAKPLWDREVEGIIVRPLPGTKAVFGVQIMFRVSALPMAGPLDLSTLAQVKVNGEVIDVLELKVSTDPTGSAGCQTPCHELDKVCVCIEGIGCGCGTILVQVPLVRADLAPGDIITVALEPLPGASPEIVEKNDARKIVWNGRPTVWERIVRSVEKEPSVKFRDRTNVVVDIGALTNFDGVLNLDTLVELSVNGKPVARHAADFDDFTWFSCSGGCTGEVCARLNGDDAGAACQRDDYLSGPVCWCNFPSLGTVSFEDLRLEKEDEVSVKISPAPGSQEDLPRPEVFKIEVGFRRGDSNDNGVADLADAVFTLSYQFTGGAAPTCADAADVNDDGVLNIGDPVSLLGWLFLGGMTPPAPGPTACGPDGTPDELPDCKPTACGD